MSVAEGQLGATCGGSERCTFRVWAPNCSAVELHQLAPVDRVVPMEPRPRGYFELCLDGVSVESHYRYVLDRRIERPDPASRFQPEGVHGASAVVDTSHLRWTDDDWLGPPLHQYVIYELHVGTFSEAGTFESAIPYLDGLKDLGITAIELMPIAQFPGERNWGYDGVYPFAVQSSYGGPLGLARLVDACHQRGLAVILDVVYNHLGPEGNYFGDFGPYFTDRYQTLWGDAINFDGPGSDEVRRYFIENALYWLETLHIDALRLDAIHAIFDQSAEPFLVELARTVHERARSRGRRAYLIAESDLNNAKIVQVGRIGGFDLDAQWNDDFHHALDACLTGSRSSYVRDFGALEDVAQAFNDGYVYTGQFSASRRRRHGIPPQYVKPDQLVVFLQNHDQIGNRVEGERLSTLVPNDDLKLAAAALILSPYIPLIFMGEEYGETVPFQYFTSHSDPELVAAVREGRRREFAELWDREAPDPQNPAAFIGSKLRRDGPHSPQQCALAALYQELLRLRRETPAIAVTGFAHQQVEVDLHQRVVTSHRWAREGQTFLTLCFGREPSEIKLPNSADQWLTALNTEDRRWLGDGSSVPASIDPIASSALLLPPRSCQLFVAGPAHVDEAERG